MVLTAYLFNPAIPLTMHYNPDHTIANKNQVQRQGQTENYGGTVANPLPVEKNSYTIEYLDYKKAAYVAGPRSYGYVQPHAPRTIIEKPSWEDVNDNDPRVKVKKLSYDANGNLTEIKQVLGPLSTSLRKNVWDEENRLMAVDLKPDDFTGHAIALYTYDAGGQRIVRYNTDRMDVSRNGREVAQTTTENVIVYPSGLLMGKALHTDKKGGNRMTYTKHYYIGSERISAKTGTSRMGFYPKTPLGSNMPYLNESMVENAADVALGNAVTRMNGVYNKFGMGLPVLTPNDEDSSTGYDHSEEGLELNIYYFHPDHLGSSAYISNASGNASQHMEYLPFGETLVDEHLNSFSSPFKYNGKEYDEETGNYYYGARYYDPKWSIFISVDPLAEKTMDAYGYCYQNPVRFIDPDGMQAYPPTEQELMDNYGISVSDIENGYSWTDSDGSWKFDKASGYWQGQEGTDVNIPAKTVQLQEVVITKEAPILEQASNFISNNVVAPFLEVGQDIAFPIINQANIIINEGIHEGGANNLDNVLLPKTYQFKNWSFQQGSTITKGNVSWEEGKEKLSNVVSVVPMAKVTSLSSGVKNFIATQATNAAIKTPIKAVINQP